MKLITPFGISILFCILCLSPLTIVGSPLPPDTVVNSLHEVTVQGNSQILNNNKATYYPTTNEKNALLTP